LRLHCAQGRRQPSAKRDRKGDRRAGAREDRPGGGVQTGDHRWALAEDALRKILRGTIKKIADGDAWTMPATIEDPKVLDEITAALKEKGVGA
jgi:hypothetical protein